MITLAVVIGTCGMYLWMPFAPLYFKNLGATSDADALAWASVALIGQGTAVLVASPVWGVLGDRYGRKAMLVRALGFACVTNIIAAVATEPWHLVLAFLCQGMLSGFVPAATALVSVSVREHELASSMGKVAGAQYLGATLGPAIGAVLATTVDLQSAIVVAAVLPGIATLLVAVTVPRDVVGGDPGSAPRTAEIGASQPISRWRSYTDLATVQFRLGLLLSFLTFAASQATRLAVPLVIAGMIGGENPATLVGLAFTLGGVASVVGVVVVGRRWSGPGVIVAALTGACLVSAAAFLLLALSETVAVFIAAFALASMAITAMQPGTSTVIAAAVPAGSRGTAFGLAGSAQALAFMAGPLAAAFFAASSFQLGFALIAVVYVLLGGLLRWKLEAPAPSGPGEAQRIVSGAAPSSCPAPPPSSAPTRASVLPCSVSHAIVSPTGHEFRPVEPRPRKK
jgi:DHA1 family multidrug resistance protein-like MFS transporter